MAAQLDAVGVVDDAVKDRVRDRGVAKGLVPLFDGHRLVRMVERR